jgi:hypothetical protein
MKMMRSVGISVVMILFSAPLVRGQDLSKYRNFSLGMSLPELSNQVDLRPLQTKLIQKHPAIIQELACWPGHSSDHSRQTDSVWQIFFSFYNGQLAGRHVTVGLVESNATGETYTPIQTSKLTGRVLLSRFHSPSSSNHEGLPAPIPLLTSFPQNPRNLR